jgi:toxin ParE1/3/4
MRNVLRTTDVAIELLDIHDYIAKDSPPAASRFLEAAEECFRQISIHPELGAVGEFPITKQTGVRRWRITEFPTYLVFYRDEGETVTILHVVHGARNLESLRDG